MTDCVVTRLEKGAIIRVLRNEPAFSEMFLSYVLSRIIRVEEDLVDQLFNSSEKRLARLLLLLANFGKESQPEPVIASMWRPGSSQLFVECRSARLKEKSSGNGAARSCGCCSACKKKAIPVSAPTGPRVDKASGE